MAMACLELSCASCSTEGHLTHHTHHTHHALIFMVTHTPHTVQDAHSPHTRTRLNAFSRLLCGRPCALTCSHPRTHSLVHSLTRSLAHSLTHLLLHSFTPIHFCSVYEKIIFTCGVIRSFDVLRCQGCVFPVDAEFTWECLMGDHLCESRSVACGIEHLHEHGWS